MFDRVDGVGCHKPGVRIREGTRGCLGEPVVTCRIPEGRVACGRRITSGVCGRADS